MRPPTSTRRHQWVHVDARGGENSKNAPSSGDWRPTLVDRVHHLVAMVAWRTLFVLKGAM